MGRKVRCLLDVNDTETFIEKSREFFSSKGYEIEVDSHDHTIIFDAGSTIWTVLGTTRWNKTDRTVILSRDVEKNNFSIKLIYDVAWLSMHYRPQSLVRDEVKELKEFIGCNDLNLETNYYTDI